MASGRRPGRRSWRLVAGTAAVLAAALFLAFAQEAAPGAASDEASGEDASTPAENRIIRIEGTGITTQGNPRFGPITYTHPTDPEGVVATVSNLTIYAQEAVLRVPGNDGAEDKRTLGEARGERAATFDGGVRALRGRLEALGPALRYDESTGLGILTGGADVTIAPADAEDDPTVIAAEGIEFDVDTDRSRSFGDVVLVDGNQRATADAMVYAEDQDLGCLTNDPGGDALPRIVRTDEDGGELVITAERICVLTGEETLHATGSVTVVDGDITSSGDEVFYDDTLQVAEVYGSPAVSVQGGSRLEAARIRQNIEFDFVEQLPRDAPTPFDPAAFEFAPSEDAGDDGDTGSGTENDDEIGDARDAGGVGGTPDASDPDASLEAAPAHAASDVAVAARTDAAAEPRRSVAAPASGTSPYTDV